MEKDTSVEKLAETKEFTLNNTLCEVGVLVATLEEDAIFGNTLSDVKAYKLIDTLDNTLAELEVKVPGDTLVDTVAAPLAEKEVEKLCDTIRCAV